jgi:hypothetical protein
MNHEWYQTEDGERLWLAKSDYTYQQALHEAAGPARDAMGNDADYYYRYTGLVEVTLIDHEEGCCCAVDLPDDDPDSGMVCRTERTEWAYGFELTERRA